MITKKLFKLSAIATVLAVTPTQAAPIYWTVHDIEDDVTQVSTDGSPVEAHTGADLGTANVVDGATQVINGVTFDDGNVGDSPTHFDTLGSRISGFSGPNADYGSMLTFADRHSSGLATFTFSGLTSGNTYQIQIWHTDNGGTAQENGMVVNDGGIVNDPNPATSGHATLIREVTEGSWGQYAIGVFVADAATQQFQARAYGSLTTSPVAQANNTINGVQLRDQGVDSSAPSPAPTIATLTPFESRVVVEATTTTTDASGVEYQFVRRLGIGGSVELTSAWQDSTTFVDTGLSISTEYSYTVTARDKTPTQYSTAESAEVAVTTLAEDTTAPNPDPMTFAAAPAPLAGSGYNAITMTASLATDDNYGVEYYFTCTAGGGNDSGWQDSPTYVDTGLNPNTEYTYTVKAQDKADTPTETAASDPESATTDAKGSATIAWNTFDITNDVTNVSTTGSPVDARSGSTTDRTVNGVIFESVANSGNLFDSLFANDTINARGWGSVVTDADYRSLLGQGQRSGRLGFGVLPRIEPSEVWTTVEFFGLTPGNTYQIQIWASDTQVLGGASTTDGISKTKALVLGDGSAGGPVYGVDTPLFYEASDPATSNISGPGQYGIGTFVADATNQAFNVRTWINLDTTPAGTNSDHFSNGWQIRDLGVVSGTPFGNWAETGTLGPVTFDGDTNGDGVQDGLAFLLGAASPDDDANGLLPTSSVDGSGGLVMTFTMLDSASRGAGALSVQHSSDLGITDAWAPATPDPLALVPDTTNTVGGVSFAVSGSGTLSVVATIPSSGNASGGKLFGRLKATE